MQSQSKYEAEILKLCKEKVANYFTRLNILTSSIDITNNEKDTIIANLVSKEFCDTALIEDYLGDNNILYSYNSSEYLNRFKYFYENQNLKRNPTFLEFIPLKQGSFFYIYISIDKIASNLKVKNFDKDTVEFLFKMDQNNLSNVNPLKIVKIRKVFDFDGLIDSDNDGIIDKDDICPNHFGAREYGGCPDSDNDNIPDIDDLCPGKKGIPECQGCADEDEDGICDSEDFCPDEKGKIEHDGCPFYDDDNDGIENKNDKCRDVPGNKNNNGCPDISKDFVVNLSLNVEQLLSFKDNSGFLKIENEQSIFDSSSQNIIITGKERLFVKFSKNTNRWNKTTKYELSFSKISVNGSTDLPLNNFLLRLNFDEIKKEFDSNTISFKLNDQPIFYAYLLGK